LGIRSGAAGDQKPKGEWPLWNGSETVAQYAKRAGLETTRTLDLGGGVKMECVLVPAGSFLMGSPRKSQWEGQGNEGPIHQVTITKPFYIGKYEVTVAQFAAFVGATKYQTYCEKPGNKGAGVKNGRWGEWTGLNWRNSGIEQTPEHPAVFVSWNDTQTFTAWVSERTGQDVRLPTEAQWEYAARGPKSLKYPFGEKWDARKVNHRDAAVKHLGWPCSSDNDGYAYTAPVGTFDNASWCGAFDLVGNVGEHVQDWEADYAADAQTDPQGPASGRLRVKRGSNWADSAETPAAYRERKPVDGGSATNGFRVVMAVSGPAAPVTSTPPAAPQSTPAPAPKTRDLPKPTALDLGQGVKVEFVLVPAGTFVMGSPDSEPGRQAEREGPLHEVTISKPFYMGKYEVTVEQFRRFVESTNYVTEAEQAGNRGRTWDNGFKELSNINWKRLNFPQEDNHPVGLLTWKDAKAFVAWATKATGKTIRLPTEAEWEYACRAQTTSRFNLGDDDTDLGRAGWFETNSGYRSHPVGRKAPNAWGLYDMHGNVWEWCEDRAQQDYYKQSPGTDPPGPAVGDDRLLRGGSWRDPPLNCRSARRGIIVPAPRFATHGFRLVLECDLAPR
jgi:formylglycine-generating enzyme required for sulfatase activity